LVVFLVCLSIPWLQRYALSAALWFVALVPGLLIWLVIGIGAEIGQEALRTGISSYPPWMMSLWHAFGSPAAKITLVAVGMAGTIVFATGVAVVHQFVIHRVTFALFRLYAGFVTATVAVLWGSLAGAIVATYLDVAWQVAFVVVTSLVVAIGWGGARLGSRIARRLRGRAPQSFTWIREDEFYGTVEKSVEEAAN
jgi:hypothetical protein